MNRTRHAARPQRQGGLRAALGVMAALAGLGGCATPPAPPELPALELPGRWREPALPAVDGGAAGAGAGADARADAGADPGAGPAADADPGAPWWQGFGSVELDALVASAGQGNPDLAAGAARVLQAQALAGVGASLRRPQLDAQLGASRAARLGGGSGDGTGQAWTSGLTLAYEVDLWGRLAAGQQGAEARWQASRHDHDALWLALSAEVADAWLDAVALHERREIARRNLADAERLLRLVESRERAGAATPLELARQRGLVVRQRQFDIALRQAQALGAERLSVLLARAEGVAVTAVSLDALVLPPVQAGLPSTLLDRRPDLAGIEAELAAADADVAAARSALRPRLTLGAGLGAGGDRLPELFDRPVYTLLAGVVGPIVDGGRRRAEQDLALAQRAELLARYRQAVVTAVAEVERALAVSRRIEEQIGVQAEGLQQAREALRLAESRYRAGAESGLGLLDAQREVHAARDEAVQLRLARLQAAVALHRALGGGWRPEGLPARPAHAVDGQVRGGA